MVRKRYQNLKGIYLNLNLSFIVDQTESFNFFFFFFLGHPLLILQLIQGLVYWQIYFILTGVKLVTESRISQKLTLSLLISSKSYILLVCKSEISDL